MALAEEREVKPNGESICSSINCGQLSIWPTHGKFVLALESGQDMADGVFRSVAAMDGEKARRTGLFGWAAGDAKSGFGRPPATLLISPSRPIQNPWRRCGKSRYALRAVLHQTRRVSTRPGSGEETSV